MGKGIAAARRRNRAFPNASSPLLNDDGISGQPPRPFGALDLALGRGVFFAAAAALALPVLFLWRAGAGFDRRQPVETLGTGLPFPPTGTFQVLNWLGIPYPASPLNPLSLAAAHASIWLFFTSYAPMVSTFALLVMAAFLRELELTRPAALFGGVVYAWQGDLLPFVYPGHYGYITSWPFFALGGLGSAARRANRILGLCRDQRGVVRDHGRLAHQCRSRRHLQPSDRRALSCLVLGRTGAGGNSAPACTGVLLGVSSLLLDLGFWLPPAAICAAFIALVALVDILKLHRLVLCVAVAALVALARCWRWSKAISRG